MYESFSSICFVKHTHQTFTAVVWWTSEHHDSGSFDSFIYLTLPLWFPHCLLRLAVFADLCVLLCSSLSTCFILIQDYLNTPRFRRIFCKNTRVENFNTFQKHLLTTVLLLPKSGLIMPETEAFCIQYMLSQSSFTHKQCFSTFEERLWHWKKALEELMENLHPHKLLIRPDIIQYSW